MELPRRRVTGRITPIPGLSCSVTRRARTPTGSASYRLALQGQQGIAGVQTYSDCINVPLDAGTWTIGFSYLVVAGTNVTTVRYTVLPYTGLGCSGSLDQLQTFVTAVNDGEWHDVSALRALATSAQSFQIVLQYSCSDSCPNTQVNFDDLVLEKVVPTAVSVSSIRAGRTPGGVVLRWRSASESDLLGFNVYRQSRDKLVKLNRTVIPSVFGGTARGHAYSWLDRGAPAEKATYRLQAVSLSGKRKWVGSAVVSRPARCRAVRLASHWQVQAGNAGECQKATAGQVGLHRAFSFPSFPVYSVRVGFTRGRSLVQSQPRPLLPI